MTGTLQATRTDTSMFDPVTGEMRDGRGRYNFDDGIGYGMIKEEKRHDDDDAVWTAQASVSASAYKAASGGERGRNKKNNTNDKRKIRIEKDLSDPHPPNLVSRTQYP